jgi:hypothetical protein
VGEYREFITPDLVEYAWARVTVIEAARTFYLYHGLRVCSRILNHSRLEDASALYPPSPVPPVQNMDVILQNLSNRLTTTVERLDRLSADTYNNRILSRNKQNSYRSPPEPLQKTACLN